MARKTYRAFGSIVSISVFIDGRNIDVNFMPVSNYHAGEGGSVFTTDDEKIQEALERSNNFGQIYHLDSSDDAGKASHGDTKTTDTSVVDGELKQVEVSSIEDAKAWLVDNCGWKPTARPTKTGIAKVASSYGYVFVGLD